MLCLYYPSVDIRPVGGPSGYLYNLCHGLNDIGFKDYCTLDCESMHRIASSDGLKKHIPMFIRELHRVSYYMTQYNMKREINSKALECDYIHFHSTTDLFQVRDSLDEYKGKILLTSHTPQASYLEKIEMVRTGIQKLFSRQLRKLEMIDHFAFSKADYIIFPCVESEEPYFKLWKNYKALRNADKIRYVPTGIIKCEAKVSSSYIRAQYGIPSDAFVISYVGRHNEIKGYTLLKQVGEELLSKNPNIWFLVAGKEEPYKGLKNKRWIEIGWTDDPHSIINAADLFILPNQETYFDLILLEVLCLAKPVIISNTGGNRLFSKFDDSGIFIFNTMDDIKSAVEYLIGLNKSELYSLGSKNHSIYIEHFTETVFAKAYCKLLESLAN